MLLLHDQLLQGLGALGQWRGLSAAQGPVPRELAHRPHAGGHALTRHQRGLPVERHCGGGAGREVTITVRAPDSHSHPETLPLLEQRRLHTQEKPARGLEHPAPKPEPRSSSSPQLNSLAAQSHHLWQNVLDSLTSTYSLGPSVCMNND